MVRQYNNKGLNEQIAAQCAPLLAGLKLSNLLIIPKEWREELTVVLRGTRFAAYCLTEYDGKQVYLLYRMNELVVYLTRLEVQELLLELGYPGGELFSLLRSVSKKYTDHKRGCAEFPHELGLLLGYPAVDVRGFMKYDGKKCRYTGYWKVYGNVAETVSLFREFDRAKEIVVQLVKKGYSIANIAGGYDRNRDCCRAVG